jgi:hypothetical protein
LKTLVIENHLVDFCDFAIWWILTPGITIFREFLQCHIDIWWKSQNLRFWWLEILVVGNFGGWKPFGGFPGFSNLVIFNHQNFPIQGSTLPLGPNIIAQFISAKTLAPDVIALSRLYVVY